MFFLEFSCCFYDPADVGNLISGSSAFSLCYAFTYSLRVLGVGWGVAGGFYLLLLSQYSVLMFLSYFEIVSDVS